MLVIPVEGGAFTFTRPPGEAFTPWLIAVEIDTEGTSRHIHIHTDRHSLTNSQTQTDTTGHTQTHAILKLFPSGMRKQLYVVVDELEESGSLIIALVFCR